jgi:hypothetical protein
LSDARSLERIAGKRSKAKCFARVYDEGNFVARVFDEVPRFGETLANSFAFAKKKDIKAHAAGTYL